VLKLVTTATNTDEVKALHHTNSERTTFALSNSGHSPITTLGDTGKGKTLVSLGGKPVIEIQLTNGTWELLVEGRSSYLHCDTPGATFSLPLLRERVRVRRFTDAGSTSPEAERQPLVYPDGVHMVQVS
jgi:hypothetical protein